MAFSYYTDEIDQLPVICLEGSLIERHEAQDLLEETNELIAEGKIRLILDLSELEYLNSSGLNVLINIFTRVRNAGGEVVMCHLNEKLIRLLVITKLDAVIQQQPTREEAAAILLSSGQPDQSQS
ncbi:MAG: hypothetical protein RLZZ543_272 [Bacteroidota bacterium]|jgi:anti-sigma B factor antagonist